MPQTSIDSDDRKPIAAGILAGFAKSLFTKSSFAFVYFVKGIFKWWFKFPIKLFRPAVLSPYMLLSAMAERQGRRVNIQSLKAVVSDEGMPFFRKNMLPVLFANGMAGAVLFNCYSLTTYVLTMKDSEFSYYKQFLCGGIAGGCHSIIGTPLDKISQIPIQEFVDQREIGMFRVTMNAINKQIVDGGNGLRRYQVLWKEFKVIAIKDSIGFSMFFGVFESMRHLGRKLATHLQKEYGDERSIVYTISNTATLLTAGALAGLSFQLTSYPIEQLRSIHSQKSTQPLNLVSIRNILKSAGCKRMFHGIHGQLLRTMPPSAVGLFIYEVASRHFWDQEN